MPDIIENLKALHTYFKDVTKQPIQIQPTITVLPHDWYENDLLVEVLIEMYGEKHVEREIERHRNFGEVTDSREFKSYIDEEK